MSSSVSSARRSGWALIRRTAREQRRGVIAGALFGLVWTAAKIAVPSATRVAIDRGIVRSEPGALFRWSIIILVLGVIQAVGMGLRRYQAFALSWKAEAGLRHRLFAHLQRLHFAFHDHSQTGQLMSRAATDMQQVQSFFTMVPITISNVVILVSVTVLLVLTNAGLALLALGSLPLVNIAAKRFSSRIHPVSVELQQELAGVSTVVEETVTGIRVVKGFGAEPILAARLRAERRQGPRPGHRGRPPFGPTSSPSSTSSPTSGSSPSSGTAGTRCSRATSPSASWSLSTSTC